MDITTTNVQQHTNAADQGPARGSNAITHSSTAPALPDFISQTLFTLSEHQLQKPRKTDV